MRTPETYRQKADRFRELAREADEEIAAELLAVAEDYDGLALRLEHEPKPPREQGA